MLNQQDSSNWVVLIVEDDPDNLSVAQQVLEFHEATIYSAVNGQVALELLETIRPTIILLDLSMPVMDGWETITVLRNDPQFELTPIIAVTAHAMEGDAEKVADAGFDGYITKPFNIMHFMDEIVACLQAIDRFKPEDSSNENK